MDQVPKPSADPNDIILKVSFAVAKGIHQNVVTLHATNGMLDKEADSTSGFIRGFLLFAQLGIRGFFTLARLLVRHLNLITTVIRWQTPIAQIDTHLEVCQPIDLWRPLVLQPAVLMVMTTTGVTEKDHELIR